MIQPFPRAELFRVLVEAGYAGFYQVNRAACEGLKVLLENPERVLKQPKRIFRDFWLELEILARSHG
jgi:hypothetical protein